MRHHYIAATRQLKCLIATTKSMRRSPMARNPLYSNPACYFLARALLVGVIHVYSGVRTNGCPIIFYLASLSVNSSARGTARSIHAVVYVAAGSANHHKGRKTLCPALLELVPHTHAQRSQQQRESTGRNPAASFRPTSNAET